MGTHTFAVLEVSKETYEEIATKLRDAGYGHAFQGLVEENGRIYEDVDMHGIAIRQEGSLHA